MAEPFIAEVKIFGFNFPPLNWAFCDGQVVPASQNQAMFSLVGTYFGGDGRSTFGYPALGGRVPIQYGTQNSPFGTLSYPMGAIGGSTDVTLSSSTMATHAHTMNTSTDNGDRPNNATGGAQLAPLPAGVGYADPGSNMTTLNAGAISSAGGGGSHTNNQPYQTLSFCIALQGIYPSRS